MRGRSRLSALLRQDLLLAHRTGLFAIVLGLAVVLALVVNFALPTVISLTAHEYVVDLAEGRPVARALEAAGRGDVLLASVDDLKRRVADDRSAVGLVFRGTPESPQVELHLQGSEPQATVNSLEAVASTLWNSAVGTGPGGAHRLVELRPGSAKVPFNKGLVPVLLVFEVVLLGFMFAGVMVFQEKAEGSIKAYRVSPAGPWPYIISKAAVNLTLSLVYGLLLVLFTLGPRPALLGVLGLVALASLLMTLFGLFLSSFYTGLSDFLYVLLLVIIVFTLPAASYFSPAFKLPLSEFMPSYPLLFGVRELAFPTGKTGFLAPMVLTLLAEIAVVAGLARWAVERKLLRGVL